MPRIGGQLRTGSGMLHLMPGFPIPGAGTAFDNEREGFMEMAASRSIVDRMRGAALLDVPTYEEVEADTTATMQAAIVVLIAAVAQAIGSLGTEGTSVPGVVIGALIGWPVWAGVTYIIGDKILGGTATWGELLRTLGFAQTPGILAVLAIVPFVGVLVRIVVGIWILVAGVIAIRQALDFSTGKAIATALIGWLCLVVLSVTMMGLGSLFS
jgi:hypothetical protein